MEQGGQENKPPSSVVELKYSGSGSTEPQIRIETPTMVPAPAPDSFIRYFEKEITFFDFIHRIETPTIYENYFSNHDFFSLKFLQVCVE
jgi:hypothetical protein